MKTLIAVLFAVYGICCMAGIAIAQEPDFIEIPENTFGWMLLKILGADAEKWLGALIALSVGLKGASATLGKVSGKLEDVAEKSKAKWDNKAVGYLSKLGMYIGKGGGYAAWLLGVFGVGNIPKSVKHIPKLKLPGKKADG